MKRFTSLMLMLLCTVTTMWAQTSYETSTAESPKWYTIGSYSRGGYLTNVGVGEGVEHVDATAGSLWYFEAVEGDTNSGVYLVNATKSGENKIYLGSGKTASTTPSVWYLLSNGVNENGVVLSSSNPVANYSCVDANNNNTGVGSWHPSSTDWEGTTWVLTEVTDDDASSMLENAKTSAVDNLNSLAKISNVFGDNSEYITAVEAKTATTIDEYVTAYNEIDAIIANYVKTVDGKNVKFCNKSTSDGRGGRYLGYDNANSRIAAVASSGDDVIWTIEANDNATVKFYNFVNDIYLGTPADPTPAIATEADAPSFTIIPTDENVAAIVATTGQMVHIANHTNYKAISYYSLTDAASLWDVTAVPAIVATHEEIAAATAAKTALPYAIQQAYGLVTDANNYYSNWKSDAEGSYEALLDNTADSYFHSAYTDDAKAEDAETHYIQADLGEGNSVGAFYFYMSPRLQNSNNRPVNITVQGSNDNVDYTLIAEVTTTLDGTMTPYISPLLGDVLTEYRYIRLTVNSTNSDSKFFTLSELYFFEATEDVKELVEAYHNLESTSITSETYTTYAQTLVNAEATLALSNIKKEIAALIDANEENHAATPVLGQYTTEGYNALLAAYNDADATQESLEAAIAAFNKTKNSPVYYITSAWDSGYPAGAAIYYDGSVWKWGVTNKYNRQAWMTIPAHAAEDAPIVDAYDADGTSYKICDYPTGSVMRGKEVQIVKIADWEGAYNLQYNANASSTDAAQHAQSGGALVNWKPATADDCQASAWRIEFIGSTYDLDQLTDEKIDALAALQTAYDAKDHYADAVIGEGVGKYTGSSDAIATALAAAEEIAAKTLAEQAQMSVEEINNATTAITSAELPTLNMPEKGKYYRIKSVNSNNYITAPASTGTVMIMDATAGANNILYWDSEGHLLVYGTGMYINGKNHAIYGYKDTYTIDDNQRNEAIAGAYTVKPSNLNYFHDNGTSLDVYKDAAHTNCNWTIEEVTTLPVAVTAAGYATLYAPVALEVADGVVAYTVTLNGQWATLNKIESGVIPANTGVVIAGAEGEAAAEDTYDFTITTSDQFAGDNALDGTVATTYVTEDAYVLGYINVAEEGEEEKKEVGFYTATKNQANGTAFQNNSHKAYLPKAQGASLSANLRFDFGDTTGVENVEIRNEKSEIFDLTGRRVETITEPGIYIVNGKKVLVK